MKFKRILILAEELFFRKKVFSRLFSLILFMNLLSCSNVSETKNIKSPVKNLFINYLLSSQVVGENTFVKEYDFEKPAKGIKIREGIDKNWFFLGESNLEAYNSQLIGKINSASYEENWIYECYVQNASIDSSSLEVLPDGRVLALSYLIDKNKQFSEILINIVQESNNNLIWDPHVIVSSDNYYLKTKDFEYIREGNLQNYTCMVFDEIVNSNLVNAYLVCTNYNLDNLIQYQIGSNVFFDSSSSIKILPNNKISIVFNSNEYNSNPNYYDAILMIAQRNLDSLESVRSIKIGNQKEELISDHIITKDGKYICFTGSIQSFNLFENRDILIGCLNYPSLTMHWAKVLGFIENSEAYEIQENSVGINIVGYVNIVKDSGTYKISITFDKNGNLLYEKVFFSKLCEQNQYDFSFISTSNSLITIGHQNDTSDLNSSKLLISKMLINAQADCEAMIQISNIDITKNLSLDSVQTPFNSRNNFNIYKYYNLLKRELHQYNTSYQCNMNLKVNSSPSPNVINENDKAYKGWIIGIESVLLALISICLCRYKKKYKKLNIAHKNLSVLKEDYQSTSISIQSKN